MPPKQVLKRVSSQEAKDFVCQLTLESFPLACFSCSTSIDTPHGFRQHLAKHGVEHESLTHLVHLRNLSRRAKVAPAQSSDADQIGDVAAAEPPPNPPPVLAQQLVHDQHRVDEPMVAAAEPPPDPQPMLAHQPVQYQHRVDEPMASEMESISPNPSNHKFVICKSCDCLVSKGRSVIGHFTRSQADRKTCKKLTESQRILDPVAVRKWKSVKDGWAIGNNQSEPACTSFERACLENAVHQPPQANPDIMAAMQAQTAAIVSAISSAREVKLPKIVIRQGPSSAASVAIGEEKVVKVKLRKAAKDFRCLTKAEVRGTEDRRLYEWPHELESKCQLDLTEVEDYIHSRCPGEKGKHNAKDKIQGLHYFFACLDFKNPDMPLLDIFIGVVRSGIIAKMMLHDIVSGSVSWARKMVAGMTLFLDWVGLKAVEVGDTQVAPALVQATRTRFIDPTTEAIHPARESAHKRRKQIDKLRSLRLPSFEVRGVACNWAMIDIDILHKENIEKFQARHELGKGIRRALYACLGALFSYRTYPCRPCELQL